IHSPEDLGQIPLKRNGSGEIFIRDIAEIRPGTMPGQYDRYNMKRQVTLTANRAAIDLGTVAREGSAAIKAGGEPTKGAKTEIRGQIPVMDEMGSGLSAGLLISVIAVFLLLTANFQSIRLALVAVSSVPAVVTGVLLMLWVTGTTLNIQSFIGA